MLLFTFMCSFNKCTICYEWNQPDKRFHASLVTHLVCPIIQSVQTSKHHIHPNTPLKVLLTYFAGRCNVYRGWEAVGNGHYKVAKIVLFFDVFVSNGNNGILLVGRNTGAPASQVSADLKFLGFSSSDLVRITWHNIEHVYMLNMQHMLYLWLSLQRV